MNPPPRFELGSSRTNLERASVLHHGGGLEKGEEGAKRGKSEGKLFSSDGAAAEVKTRSKRKRIDEVRQNRTDD